MKSWLITQLMLPRGVLRKNMVSPRYSLKLVLCLYYQVASLFAFSRFLERFSFLFLAYCTLPFSYSYKYLFGNYHIKAIWIYKPYCLKSFGSFFLYLEYLINYYVFSIILYDLNNKNDKIIHFKILSLNEKNSFNIFI